MLDVERVDTWIHINGGSLSFLKNTSLRDVLIHVALLALNKNGFIQKEFNKKVLN
jgi:hypothetical protein